ncbi:uncharacterized protein LOC132044469 [Lycium ferocissimum]|uniref:uncharacterized protein LOC132044469 n=1 Tax=Lycium ferocissimum TaxID=112874 RepID=UPI002814B249|nr:uncharacterized protein LOC132044469 [Lycium ferocissimum]
MERFIGIVLVRDTTALSLKKGIVGLLSQHSLSSSYIRGQCYDRASNMQGDINGLKILMQQESKGAHSIHCFAHQLQLTLVAISRKCDEVQELLLLVSDILNMVGASLKRRDELDSFSHFDIEKILRLAELYPDDFDKYSMVDLRFQLENYIVDVQDHDKRFSNLKGLVNLSKILVETKKHGTYPLVFRLVKFALLLPVATITVERAFSSMKLIKTDLRNRMDDELLSGCLVPSIEKEVFSTISNEAIMNTFQKMKTRRGEL